MNVRAIAAAALLMLVAADAPAAPNLSTDELDAIARIAQDVAFADLLARTNDGAPKGDIAFVDVTIVDPLDGSVKPRQTVLVHDRSIAWTGDATQAAVPPGALKIDGAGRFLSPGLTDMHVHTQGLGEHVLRLAAGATAVRDMDGFPWLLRLRDSVRQDRMLAATEYVAGTIIADHPLFGYAVVVHTADEARSRVRAQIACGYEFIKVHNLLAPVLFDAIADEAHRGGKDLVGHVPHDIALDHAIHVGRMRTIEHLKGFLNDRTLLPSDEDYAKALSGAQVWLAPTLYTNLSYERGERARRIVEGPLGAYAPLATRRAWSKLLQAPADDPDRRQAETTGARFRNTQSIVVKRLVPLHPHWLAGTDAAGYDFNIAGFALLDELDLMERAGVQRLDVLRAATTDAAAAMRKESEFGRIRAGMRADMILLDTNPLDDLSAYRRSQGVMAHGHWLDRAMLDSMLASLTKIYASPSLPELADSSTARELAKRVDELTQRGVVFESQALLQAAAALREAGQTAPAARLTAAAAVPATGPCAADTPPGTGDIWDTWAAWSNWFWSFF